MSRAVDGAFTLTRRKSLRNQVASVSWIIAGTGFSVAALALAWRQAALSFLAIAFVFGWTQVSTPCGGAIVGAFTDMARTPGRRRRRWLVAVALYTLSGLATSVGVGAGIAGLAEVAHVDALSRSFRLSFLALLALVLAAREAGVIQFRLPQRRRPSIQWFSKFGFFDAAIMWGAHIGLGFFTFFNYGGPYTLLAVAALNISGDPVFVFGGSLMGTYWLGRALSAWIAPTWMPPLPGVVTEVIATINKSYQTQRRIEVIGLSGMVILSVVLLYTH